MQIMVQHCAVEDDVALGRRHGSLLSDRNQWWIIKALDRGSPRSVAWVIGGLDIQLLCISSRGGHMQVAKWGNSLAVRLPAAVVEALSLREGDDIEIEVAGARTFEIRKKPETRELLARLRKYRGRLPADFKFDRLDAHARD